MLKLPEFLRKYALRANQTIATAKIINAANLSLPLGSAIHYRGESQVDRGIVGSNLLVRNYNNRIRVYHETENYGTLGSPSPRAFQAKKEQSLYFRQQRNFAKVTRLDRVMDVERDLLIFDYTFFNHMYRYRESSWTRLNEWRNIAYSYLARINESDARHHFIYIPVPETLPDKIAFSQEEVRLTDLEKLTESSHFWLRELYRFMEGDGEFTKVEKPETVAIALVEGNHLILLPLNVLKEISEKENQALKLYGLFERAVELHTETDSEALKVITESENLANENSEVPIERQVSELLRAGAITAGEQKRFMTLIEKSKDLVDKGTGRKLSDIKVIKPEDLKVDGKLKNQINKNVLKESSQSSTVTNFTKDYVENVMEADIANMITSISKAGYINTSYETTQVVDAANNAFDIRLGVLPLHGKASTLNIRIPKVQPDGSFLVDGIKNTLDIQRVDMPIRKAGADKVALTSYFGKVFVTRSSRMVNSYSRWLIAKLTAIGLDVNDKRIDSIQFGGEEVPKEELPRTYTALLEAVTVFTAKGSEYHFAYSNRKERYGEDRVKAAEKNGHVVCGKVGKDLITINHANTFFRWDGKNYIDHSTISSILDIAWSNIPLDVAEVAVMGKRVPLTLMMAYYKGLSDYLKDSKVPHRIIPAGKRTDLLEKELRIKFKDSNLILDLSDPLHAMLFSGLRSVSRYTSHYNLTDMDKKGGIIALFNDMEIRAHVIRELDLMLEMFIDPITEEILKDMKEPTTLEGLLLRSAELLLLDNHPDETDPRFMRLRGYERFSGLIYLSLVEAIRAHKSKPNKGSIGLAMPNNEVWRRIVTDPTTQSVEDTNPMQALKEQEAISLTGEGGRGARTLVARTRVFHERDLGVISEASPDSAKVGIKTYASPNANITSMRGIMEGYKDDSPISSILSSTAQIMPASHTDDGKRIVLASSQSAAVVPCAGYQSMPFRTGVESVVASRVGDKFTVVAQEDGEITKVTDRGFTVEYKSGKKAGYELGISHGTKSGDYFPMEMITDREPGYRFKEGEVLAWNSAFFERDMFSPNNVTMLMGVLARVAILESNDTHEDSSSISPRLSAQLNTTITKRRTLLVDFNSEISNLVSVGDELGYESVLATLSASSLGNIEQTAQSIQALSDLAATSPKSKFSGKVTNVEIFYMGKLDNMTDSLRKVVKADNKRRKELRELMGDEVAATGELSKQTNVGGELLLPNTVAISVYIDMPNDAGDGDKCTLGNQLKTIHKRVFKGRHECADGTPIDMYFGARSIQARIVESVFIMGTMNTTLIAGSNRMADIYFGS